MDIDEIFNKINRTDYLIGREKSYAGYLSHAKDVTFVMWMLLGGVLNHFISKRFKYPYTVGCFLLGMLIGFLESHNDFLKSFTKLSRMNPSDMMLTFLPILIFESSFSMDPHMFFRAKIQCLTLALPGLFFCTALTAVFSKIVLASYEWSWVTAWVFGSIISATDPVGVVALLKEMRMPHTFTILIEGESLLNDGVVIVMYDTLSHFLYSHSKISITSAFLNLVKTCVGAPLLGFLIAKIAECILNRIYISAVSEMSLTLVLAYTTYFVAEKSLGISGVLAVVLYGVTLNSNKMCISPESESLIHADWRLLCTYANTIIFTLVGILISVHLESYVDWLDIGLIFATYIALNLIRALMVILCFPILKSTGYGLNWKEAVILVWGGLRGAIGLALALMFVSNPRISGKPHKVLVQTSGIIILTVLLNSTTIKRIMRWIKFSEITLVQRLSMGNAIACINEMRDMAVRIAKNNWKYKNAAWDWVMKITLIRDPYLGGIYVYDPTMHSLFIPYGTCDKCLMMFLPAVPNNYEITELTEAARVKVLRALKGNFWKQFRAGLIERQSLKYLCDAANNVSDIPNAYLKAHDVSTQLTSMNMTELLLESQLSEIFNSCFVGSVDEEERHYLRTENCKGFRKLCSNIYLSWWFEPFILVVVVLVVVEASLDIEYALNSSMTHEMEFWFQILKTGFCIILIADLIIRVIALKWTFYLKRRTNWLFFLVTCVAIVAIIADYIIMESHEHESDHSHWICYLRLIIVFRFLRAGRTVRALLYNTLSPLRSLVTERLYTAYDIGRAFLFANEEVLKTIDALVDFGPCGERAVAVCEENVESMLHVLSEFEKQYPEVTFALKSNRAARYTLNRAKEVLERFGDRSIVLKEELTELKILLFKMTKEVVYAPKKRVLIESIHDILDNSFWVRNSGLAKELIENHVICHFQSGHIIQQAGKVHKYVYIVASGMIKVTGKCDSDSSKSKLYNQLPNTDSFLMFRKREGKLKDHLITSQTIGLLGFLQGTPSETAAVCEKDCQLIRIDHSYLLSMKKNYTIEYFMWRYVAIRVAVAILKQQNEYKGYADEEIHTLLDGSILPDMTNVSTFEMPEIVDGMVLIQGKAKYAQSSAKFNGPVYVAPAFKSLVFFEDMRKRPPTIVLLVLKPKYNLRPAHTWIRPEDISLTHLSGMGFTE